MRKLLITAVGLVLALSLTASAAAEEPAPATEEAPASAPATEAAPLAGCPLGVVCVYVGTNFTGAEGQTVCSAQGVHPLAGNKRSAANGCTGRPVFLRFSGIFTGVCLPAGTSDPNILFNEIRVGQSAKAAEPINRMGGAPDESVWSAPIAPPSPARTSSRRFPPAEAGDPTCVAYSIVTV